MRVDQLSGWQLLEIQIAALLVVTTTLWLVGLAFRRSRAAKVVSLLAAIALGAAIAVGIFRSPESVVSSYLFAACLFMLGTVIMSVFLLAAIPQTREAALGGMIAGVLMIIVFVLAYWLVFSFGRVRWIEDYGRRAPAPDADSGLRTSGAARPPIDRAANTNSTRPTFTLPTSNVQLPTSR